VPLIILNFPQVLPDAAVGEIVSITNAKMPGGQGMRWSFEQLGGWWIGARLYTLTLRVITNSPFVGPIQIIQALQGIAVVQGNYYQFPLPEYPRNPNLPGIIENDQGSLLQTIDLKQESEDAKQWLATLEYGPFDVNHELGNSQITNGSINPTDAAPTVRWSSAKYEISYPQDINGNDFVNTVGDPLENPPKREESRQRLSYTANYAQYNETWAQSFRDSINSDVFLGFQPHQVKCADIQGDRIYTADYGYYWRVAFEFEFRVQVFTDSNGNTQTYGFEDLVLNAGMRQLNTNSTLSQIIINGVPVTSPVPLTQDGSPLNSTWAQANNPSPVYLVFLQYATSTFANLNIEQSILTANQ
jgi:hypothetical protein